MNRTRKYILTIGFDLIFIAIALVITFLVKGSRFHAIPEAYGGPILIFIVVWIVGSLIARKYELAGMTSTYVELSRVIKVNTLLLLALTFIIFFANMNYSRGVLLGMTGITTALELLATWMVVLLGAASYVGPGEKNGVNGVASPESHVSEPSYEEHEEMLAPIAERMQAPVVFDASELYESISEMVGEEGFNFINRMLQGHPGQTLIVATTTRFNIVAQPRGVYSNIVNLRRINDIPRINKFFEEVNSKLPPGGVFIDCVETTGQRRARIMAKFPPVINTIYYFFDFIIKRVFPKLPVTKEIYFFLTRGNNRVLSKAETYGRLYSCGFELREETRSNNMLFFAARKVKEPVFDMQPTYGPLIKLRRHGKDGKMIGVYKMRTMHPYSEYLQQYMYDNFKLAPGGKIANDFRITTAGRIMRRLWLDELPMLLNLLKGDLKLVGVRPLSKHYFSLYPEDMQQRRSRYKPGLVPPFYVDMPKTFDDIVNSERRYLDSYDKHPWRTDWVYFWRAVNNIVVKKARSG
ncbi:MAG TPA: sugar transferase [Bacteroidota bacterium]|nr:sugar transferase [Bacteroidota bacterium]